MRDQIWNKSSESGKGEEGNIWINEWVAYTCPINANESTYKTWGPKKCNEIYMPQNLKGVKWLCQEHREKPPRGKKRKIAKN